MTGRLAALAPFRTVFNDPIGQCPLKSDIPPGFLRLDPLVFEDLLAFGLELPVKRRVLQQLVGRERLFRFVRHNRALKWFCELRYYPLLNTVDNLILHFLQLHNTTQPRRRPGSYSSFLRNASATLIKARPAGFSPAETTTGSPRSPASRISVNIGTSPRNDTFW